MTTNQIAYWKLQEEKRHNLVGEGHEDRKIVETKRHNSATEMYQLKDLGEKVRHNKVTEGQGADSLVLNRARLQEDIRHNTNVEKETKRSNVARESETVRSNLARETENIRSNKAKEFIESGKLAETTRHNLVMEPIERQKAANQLTPWGMIDSIVGALTGNNTGSHTANLIGRINSDYSSRTSIQRKKQENPAVTEAIMNYSYSSSDPTLKNYPDTSQYRNVGSGRSFPKPSDSSGTSTKSSSTNKYTRTASENQKQKLLLKKGM